MDQINKIGYKPDLDVNIDHSIKVNEGILKTENNTNKGDSKTDYINDDFDSIDEKSRIISSFDRGIALGQIDGMSKIIKEVKQYMPSGEFYLSNIILDRIQIINDRMREMFNKYHYTQKQFLKNIEDENMLLDKYINDIIVNNKPGANEITSDIDVLRTERVQYIWMYEASTILPDVNSSLSTVSDFCKNIAINGIDISSIKTYDKSNKIRSTILEEVKGRLENTDRIVNAITTVEYIDDVFDKIESKLINGKEIIVQATRIMSNYDASGINNEKYALEFLKDSVVNSKNGYIKEVMNIYKMYMLLIKCLKATTINEKMYNIVK